MSEKIKSPFVAEAILTSFKFAEQFDKIVAVSPKEQPAFKLLFMADLFSKLLNILETLRYSDGHKAVQINSYQVLSLEVPNQPKVIELEKFTKKNIPFLSFADLEQFGIKPQLTGLQPVF